VFGCAPAQNQSVLTALRALKIAQRRLRPEVRSKLLSVASARSDSSLSPAAWRFVFMDQGTSGHCRVVTVAAKASSEHPDTIEAFSDIKDESSQATTPIAQAKLGIDSDKALVQAKDVAKLKGITAAQYRLVQARSTQEPVWTLSLYAQEEEPIVRIQVGARTGAVRILNGEV
jgi:tRNA threonylcarbamoyladenosine modification (KEOPS) complex  Pcc1 subunit